MFARIQNWLIKLRHVMTRFFESARNVRFLAYIGTLLALGLTIINIHRWQRINGKSVDDVTIEASPEEFTAAFETSGLEFLVAHIGLLSAFLLPAWIGWIIWRRRVARETSITLPVAYLSLAVALTWIPLTYRRGMMEASGSILGDEPWTNEYFIVILLLVLLIFSVPLMCWLYHRAMIIDRYVVNNFLSPFLLAFGGFTAIWIISDMANNAGEFADANVSLLGILKFYAALIPNVTVLILPITMLLALLYSLSKMSKANELISILSAGMSSTRVLLPLMIIGLYATFISLVCSFHWAPRAEGAQKAMMEDLIADAKSKDKKKKRKRDAFLAENQAYINRIDNRQWFVGALPQNYSRDNKMQKILVADFSPDGKLERTIVASQAFWDGTNDLWVFFQGRVTDVDEDGRMARPQVFDKKHLEQGWRERPWDLISAGVDPEYLGVPQLSAFLRAHTTYPEARLAPYKVFFHHRIATAFTCFVAVIIGAPLGIVYSRRGILGGVAASMIIFFAILFLSNLFLALGQSSSLPPMLAAWLTNLLFGSIGAYLLWSRSQNKEIKSPAAIVRCLVHSMTTKGSAA